MTKDDVADALDEIGTLLELKGENAFRTNAYHNAARLVQSLPGDLEQMVAEGSSKRFAGSARRCARRSPRSSPPGSCRTSKTCAPPFPRGWCRCCACRGWGRRRSRHCTTTLGIDTIEKLKAACEAGRSGEAEGLRREDAAEDPRRASRSSTRSATASASTRPCRSAGRCWSGSREFPGVIRIGAVRQPAPPQGDGRGHRHPRQQRRRRRRSWTRFVKLPEVVQVLGAGADQVERHRRRCTSRREGRRSTPTCAWSATSSSRSRCTTSPAARSTTSAMRQRAIDRGLKLNEYALAEREEVDRRARRRRTSSRRWGWRTSRRSCARTPARSRRPRGTSCPTWSRRTTSAASSTTTPTYSDGGATLEEMAQAAKKLGLRVLRHRRPLAVADRRPRPAAGRGPQAAGRDRRAEREAQGHPHLQGHRVRHPRRRLARLRRRPARRLRLRRRQRPHALQACRRRR